MLGILIIHSCPGERLELQTGFATTIKSWLQATRLEE